jgi:hypothetical protein
VIDAAALAARDADRGRSDVALQLLEQSPPGAHLDFGDLQGPDRSYDAQLETLINGAGTGQTFTGILNLPTGAGARERGHVTTRRLADRAADARDGQAVAQIGDKRYMPPEVWLMRTARWAWIASAT